MMRTPSPPSRAGADAKAPLRDLIARHGIKISRDPPFQLSAGGTSPYLFDLKPVMLLPEACALLGDQLFAAARAWQPTHVGGMEMGGVPLAALVAEASFRAGAPAKGFFVRKQAKGHGVQQQIDGNVPHQGRIVVVEDVTTTGASVLEKAVPRLREVPGAQVVGVVAIVDREQGAVQNFARAGIPFTALFTLRDFKELAEFL